MKDPGEQSTQLDEGQSMQARAPAADLVPGAQFIQDELLDSLANVSAGHTLQLELP